MNNTPRILAVALAFAAFGTLAACTSSRVATAQATGPTLTEGLITPPIMAPGMQQPGQTAVASVDVSAFISPSAIRLMSARERQEASTAQSYALQFGRPGAPRTWQGDVGSAGSVTVGPYVRVNNLDCRDFTHTVNIEGQSYSQRGLACRELDGRWTVMSSSPA